MVPPPSLSLRDNLLLEAGFLAILIAPMRMPWGSRSNLYDGVTFWLVRWLLFRLMFASGVVKLNSRCPTWWGLTGKTRCRPALLSFSVVFLFCPFPQTVHESLDLWNQRLLTFMVIVKCVCVCVTAVTYHYETQCIPTPLAWFAHQLPVWFQKLSVAGTFVIQIPGPFLFFSPVRRHRLLAFYMQVGGACELCSQYVIG